MDGLTIYIDWQYFLGVVGALIGIAYYSNGRFTRLETSVDWLKETLLELKLGAENSAGNFFAARSPLSLTIAGKRVLSASGLKAYLDEHRSKLLARCRARAKDPYELRRCTYELMAELPLTGQLHRQLRLFASEKGLSIEMIRRLGAIYLIEQGV